MDIANALTALDAAGLRRSLRALPGVGGKLQIDGRPFLNFSSNDYLDLAKDARVKAAAVAAIERWGCGATASRLMSGHLEIHAELEARLAALVDQPAALVFGSGFATNLGVLTALAGRDGAIFADRLNHASLVDGAQLSRAKVHRYRHADAAHLEELLERHPNAGTRLIVTDSIFSMDGDCAPLEAIAALAKKHDAMWVVDEAHAIGVFGPDGGGVCRGLGLRPDVTVGTLGKALGSFGGFAAAAREVIDLLVNRARSFIFATALPPASVGAALGALDVLGAEPDLGVRLLGLAHEFHAFLSARGLTLPAPVSQIIPAHVGRNAAALKAAAELRTAGIIAAAVRPPTVPAGTARLRLSVTLAHGADDLRRAADLIARTLQSTERNS